MGTAETYAGEITPGLFERGAEIEARLALGLEYFESPRYNLSRLLIRLGEIERPRTLLDDLEKVGADRGDEGTRMMALWTLCMVEWLAGRLPRALNFAAAAYELTEQTQNAHGRIWAGRYKPLVEADLGLVEQARASAEEGLAFSERTSNRISKIFSLAALGHIELVLGNRQDAARYLRTLPEQLLAGGVNDPTQPVWADAIETLVGVGEIELADAYLVEFELHAKLLASPWAIGGAARCRGLVAAAAGDVVAAVDAFERSLAAFERGPYPSEVGRTLLYFGVTRRQAQQKRSARELLTQAATIFEGLETSPWLDHANAELRRISGRQPAALSLTETELQAATLAAQGRSNKQIAAELFMGVSTVESHLSRVYRKLGVRRTELGTVLEPRAEPATPMDSPSQS